jgi:hypothetical protein
MENQNTMTKFDNPWTKLNRAAEVYVAASAQEDAWGQVADAASMEMDAAEGQIALVENKIEEQASNAFVFMIAAVVIPVAFQALWAAHMGFPNVY